MARYNKIYAGPVSEPLPQVQEGLTGADITPGMIITRDAAGAFIPHDVAGGRGNFFVAQDNYLAMDGVDVDIDEGNTVMALTPLDEQLFYVRVADGNDIPMGGGLTSDGAGLLALAATGNEVLFYAEEAYNNNTGEPQLVLARKATGTAA